MSFTDLEAPKMVAQETIKSKRVVQEVSGWLRIYDDGSVDRTWTGPPEVLPFIAPVPPYDAPRDGVTVHDLPGNPSLRVYLPADEHGSAKPHPVLLHFHGGGFCISDPYQVAYHHFYASLARSVPAAVVSVELPLAPEHRLPAAHEAAYKALLWLRSLARGDTESCGGAAGLLRSAADFSRVFLIGDSSGGNLVHEVAARAGKEGEEFWAPLRVAGGIPIHPGFVRAARSRSELEQRSTSPFFTLDMLDKFLELALPEGATKDHPYTCPMGEAAPPLEGLRLPALLVGVAEGDLIRDTSMEYVEALRRAGKEVELVFSEGVGHSFYLNKLAVELDPLTAQRTHELVGAIEDFVARH